MTIPNAKVAPRTTAKMGMIGAFRMSPRRTAARGATKIAVKAGRQSWRALWMISSWNKPNHGASRNHPATSGKNTAAIRGRKDKPASPCVEKPMIVTRPIARISPQIRIRLFMREENGIQSLSGASLRDQRLESLDSISFLSFEQTLYSVVRETIARREWNVCRAITS